jgi:carboxypeptidase C (cathepsin A)
MNAERGRPGLPALRTEDVAMNASIGRWGRLLRALGFVALLAAPLGAVAQRLPAHEARAGMLNVGADPEHPDAEIFHVSYAVKGGDPATRPVTFVFNGPGASSAYLHLSAIGPKTLVTTGDGSFPSVPARLEDNPDSWLTFTDLVFIDPMGTGYSRMLPRPDGTPGDPRPYYGVESDVNFFAGFIRQWLTVNKRWASPKAIAGESYAGQRIAGLTRVLAEGYGINLNRAVLISPAFNVPEIIEPFPPYDLLHAMTLLPTLAATAAHHGRSTITNDAAGYRAAEDFALTDYLAGLATLGRMDTQAQSAFYKRVGGMIGIDPALVAANRGRVGEAVFGNNLLASRGLVLDLYDGTQATENPTPEKRDEYGARPRSLSILTGVLQPPLMDYLQKDLGYVTDRPYLVLDLEVGALWDRKSTMGTPGDLAIALAQNTDLQALVVHGYHDLGANYFLSRYLLEQVVETPSARQRLTFHTYPGGHMFYLNKRSRAELAADVRRFYEGKPGTGK